MNIRQTILDLKAITKLPRLSIDLGRDEVQHNDPFFLQAVDNFYRAARKRHPKFPLIRSLQYGVAVLTLPEDHSSYLQGLESAARRNIKKASRKGYQFRRFSYNDYLADIGEIHCSAKVRQGPMSAELLNRSPAPVHNPATNNDAHDYPYFGVFKDEKLVAYAGCLVAGEMLLLATVFGHDQYKSDAVVPFLISGIAEYKYSHYSRVKYYVYDKYYGASENLRRFKRKFRFEPHVVNWCF